MAKRRKMTRRHPRRAFEFETKLIGGQIHTIKWLCPVKLGTKKIAITLTADDVKKSIAANGHGDPCTCAMAQALDRQADKFPHPYAGRVDWLFKTAFIVSHNDASGMPKQCVKYEHRDDIAHLFDKANDEALLKAVEKAGGSITINLIPARFRVGETTKGGETAATGKRTTARGGTGRGSNAGRAVRFAMGQGYSLDEIKKRSKKS